MIVRRENSMLTGFGTFLCAFRTAAGIKVAVLTNDPMREIKQFMEKAEQLLHAAANCDGSETRLYQNSIRAAERAKRESRPPA